MPLSKKNVTGSSVTFKSIMSTGSDEISLPKSIKITEDSIKSSKRSQQVQA